MSVKFWQHNMLKFDAPFKILKKIVKGHQIVCNVSTLHIYNTVENRILFSPCQIYIGGLRYEFWHFITNRRCPWTRKHENVCIIGPLQRRYFVCLSVRCNSSEMALEFLHLHRYKVHVWNFYTVRYNRPTNILTCKYPYPLTCPSLQWQASWLQNVNQIKCIRHIANTY